MFLRFIFYFFERSTIKLYCFWTTDSSSQHIHFWFLSFTVQTQFRYAPLAWTCVHSSYSYSSACYSFDDLILLSSLPTHTSQQQDSFLRQNVSLPTFDFPQLQIEDCTRILSYSKFPCESCVCVGQSVIILYDTDYCLHLLWHLIVVRMRSITTL